MTPAIEAAGLAPLDHDEAALRSALAGARRLDAEAIERLAEYAYQRARLAHSLTGELSSPVSLAKGLGLVVRPIDRALGVDAARCGRIIFYREGLARADEGLAVALMVAVALLAEVGAAHMQGDAVALGLALLAPRATLAAAHDEGELSAEGLRGYQRHAPAWALQLRVEIAAR